MTTLGSTNDLFKKYQDFRDSIMACQSVAEIATVKTAMKPYLDKTPEEGGLKMDLRKVLENCMKIKEAELYGETPPVTNLNTQTISKDMQPISNASGSDAKVAETIKETVPTQPQETGAQEVTLPPAPTTSTPLTGRAQEIAKDMKDIDAENFKPDIVSPSGTAQEMKPVEDKGQAELQKEVINNAVNEDKAIRDVIKTEGLVPEKKPRSRNKPTEETTTEYIPRSQKSVKIFRRINVSINGVAYTNNEVGYEVIADTREEALEEAKALREASLIDIRELNQLMKVQPATQTTPPAVNNTPPPAPVTQTPATVAQPTVTVSAPEGSGSKESATLKNVQEVFGGFDLDKVMKAVAAKSPAGLEEGHEFDRYNLERLRALFTILRSVDEVAVQNPDGSGMMLGAYITQETQKFGAQFPMAKP